MKILILGDMGQLGSALRKNLEQNHEVKGWDIKRSQSEDLRIHGGELLRDIATAEFVVFLAFDVGGSKYLNRYQCTNDFISNNARIMENTFHALNVSGTPFIFASSQMASITRSPYGVLKLLGEKYTKSLGGISARLWNVYGEEPRNEKSHVITDFIHMARDGEIRMLTDGSERRQFLHTDDFCSAVRCVMELYHRVPREVHVSSFEWTPILDVAQIIADKMGAKVIPGKLKDSIQSGEVIEPEGNLLPWWRPAINLRTGIAKIIKATA